MTKFYFLISCLLLIYFGPSGTTSRTIGQRIIGGEAARAGQFPFAAAIYISTTTGTYFCTGTIIHNFWVLTAAQCVDGAIEFTILLGTNNLQELDANSVTVVADTYYIHPDYDAVTLQNDVALIRFRLPVSFSAYIKSVNWVGEDHIEDGTAVVTFGWGQTSDAIPGLVNELHYVDLATLSHAECVLAFGTQVTENMVCASGNYNEGTCRGDLGSPLIRYGGMQIAYHIGISTFISSKGCESTDPSGYTRTNMYRSWIRNITGF